jgi:hypothetical protein
VLRSLADVGNDHVVFEVECIDRMYCTVHISGLQYAAGLVGYVHPADGSRSGLSTGGPEAATRWCLRVDLGMDHVACSAQGTWSPVDCRSESAEVAAIHEPWLLTCKKDCKTFACFGDLSSFLHMAGTDAWRCRPSRPSVRSPLGEGSARTSSWRNSRLTNSRSRPNLMS